MKLLPLLLWPAVALAQLPTPMPTVQVLERATCPLGYGLPHAGRTLAQDGSWHVVTNQAPSRYLRFNAPLTDLTNQTDFVFALDGLHNFAGDAVLLANPERTFTLFRSTMIAASTVTTATLDVTDVLRDVGFLNYAPVGSAVATDGTAVYLGVQAGIAAQVLKYRISDWAFQEASEPFQYVGNAHALEYDPTSGCVFLTTDAGAVLRLRDDLTLAEPPAFIGSTLTDDFAVSGGYLWLGTESSSSIVRVRTTDLSDQTVIPTGLTSASFGVFASDGFIWSAQSWAPGRLVRVDPANLSDVRDYTFPLGDNQPSEMAFPVPGIALVTFYTNPCKVARIKLPDTQSAPSVTASPSVTMTPTMTGTATRPATPTLTAMPTVTPTPTSGAAHITLSCPNGVALGATCTVVAP